MTKRRRKKVTDSMIIEIQYPLCLNGDQVWKVLKIGLLHCIKNKSSFGKPEGCIYITNNSLISFVILVLSLPFFLYTSLLVLPYLGDFFFILCHSSPNFLLVYLTLSIITIFKFITYFVLLTCSDDVKEDNFVWPRLVTVIFVMLHGKSGM